MNAKAFLDLIIASALEVGAIASTVKPFKMAAVSIGRTHYLAVVAPDDPTAR